MAVYSQSSFNVAQAGPHLLSSNSSNSSNSSTLLFSICPTTMTTMVMFSTYTFVGVLLLPLCIFILHLGFQQWRGQRSGATMSHSDVFTFHMVVLNIIAIVGSLLLVIEVHVGNSEIMFILGNFLSCIVLPGHTFMHCLTCLDLYLAVVHPVTYMRLRQTGGARIRNTILGCVWLLLLGMVAVMELKSTVQISRFYVILMCVFVETSLFALLFFCFSVIYALIHSRPGERGGHSDRVDQSKRRAFRIILVIMAVLLMEFVPLLVTFALYQVRLTSFTLTCALLDCLMWVTLPGSLILPVLFLHRAGKFKFCRRSTESR